MLSRVKCAVFCVSLLLLPLIAFAADARGPIAGTYLIKSTRQNGKAVNLTISFRLFNHSTGDLKNASLMLADHMPALPSKTPPTPGVLPSQFNNYGAVSIPAIASHKELVINNAKFSIPALEYKQWQAGAHAVFVLTYVEKGSRVEVPVQLMEMHGGLL